MKRRIENEQWERFRRMQEESTKRKDAKQEDDKRLLYLTEIKYYKKTFDYDRSCFFICLCRLTALITNIRLDKIRHCFEYYN